MRSPSLWLAALLLGGAARAEDAPPPVPDDTAELHEVLPQRYHYSSFGPMLTAELGSSMSGDHVAGQLGFQTFGLKTSNRTWLTFWDADIAVRLGGFGNEHPFFFFGGGSGHGMGELARRVLPQSKWSPYISGRLEGDLSVMATPVTSINTLNTINSTDNFGGIVADAAARLTIGMSYLKARRSFVVSVFLQESLHAPRIVQPGYAFTEGGLLGRYDIADSFTLFVEAILGTTAPANIPGLNATNRTVDMNVAGTLRKQFKNGIWFAAQLSYGRYTHQVVYATGGTYYPADPPVFTAVLAFGIPLGRPEPEPEPAADVGGQP
jgi:hypothetical protein